VATSREDTTSDFADSSKWSPRGLYKTPGVLEDVTEDSNSRREIPKDSPEDPTSVTAESSR